MYICIDGALLNRPTLILGTVQHDSYVVSLVVCIELIKTLQEQITDVLITCIAFSTTGPNPYKTLQQAGLPGTWRKGRIPACRLCLCEKRMGVRDLYDFFYLFFSYLVKISNYQT